MAKRYFFDLVYSRRIRPDGVDVLLGDLGATKRYGTRLLAEHIVANTGERDKQFTMIVRYASWGHAVPAEHGDAYGDGRRRWNSRSL